MVADLNFLLSPFEIYELQILAVAKKEQQIQWNGSLNIKLGGTTKLGEDVNMMFNPSLYG